MSEVVILIIITISSYITQKIVPVNGAKNVTQLYFTQIIPASVRGYRSKQQARVYRIPQRQFSVNLSTTNKFQLLSRRSGILGLN